MFARILEVNLRPEVKAQFIESVREEVLPVLKKQHGFLEFLPSIRKQRPRK